MSILTITAIIYIFIGWKTSKNINNRSDYFLSGRDLGFFSLLMTLLATQIGGGTILGSAEEAYSKGWTVIFYPLGVSLGLILLSFGFGAKLRKLNLHTISELFEKIYESTLLRKFASILSIVSLFFILVGMGIATQKLFLAMGFAQKNLFFVFWTVVILYTVMGGLNAVVLTDVVQILFIIASLVLAFLFSDTSSLPLTESNTFVTDDSIPWGSWLLMPLLFMLIEQDMAQRCFAARTPILVSLSTAFSGLILFVICLIPIYFGLIARESGLVIPQGASVLLTTITATTSPTISAIAASAILMAIISTADSLLCSISSNLSYDFPIFQTRKSSLKLAQGITFATGMLGMLTSFFFDNVVSLLILSYVLSVSVLFVPISMAVLDPKPCKRGAICSMLCGSLAFAYFKILNSTPIFGQELITLAFSMFGYWMTKLRFQKKKLNEI